MLVGRGKAEIDGHLRGFYRGFNQADVQYIIEYILRKGRVRGDKEDHHTQQVLNIVQKVPETVIHLKVDEDRAVKSH